MSWANRLVGLFLRSAGSPGPHGKRVSRPKTRRAALEPLENRRLLAVAGTADFGDLPDNYGTTLVADGARHECAGPTLGATRDAEGDGQPTTAANGDDTTGSTDEDGVVFGLICVGQVDASATVVVRNAPSGAKLDAWIDFNQDGSFGGSGEKIAASVDVVQGDNVIEFDVPSWAVSGETYARFRLSTAGDLGPTGSAADGEVEDYLVEVDAPPTTYGNFVACEPLAAERFEPRAVFSVDMDGDGDADVLSASDGDDTIAWYENDGDGNFMPHTITSSAPNALSVYAADLDGDGDMDVLATSYIRFIDYTTSSSYQYLNNRVIWFENDGNQNFTIRPVSTDVRGPQTVFAADVDGDGDTDVLAGDFDSVFWFENDGEGSFTTRVVDSSNNVKSVFAADVDGDGDMDVLSAYSGYVIFHENDGLEDFTSHTITDSALGAHSVFAADINGDGRLDVVSAAQRYDEVTWYQNLGNGSFAAHSISTSADGVASVFVADLDSDGDMDILSASWWDDKISWYENRGYFTEHVISTSADLAESVFAIDVDSDGDMDVLSASRRDDKIAWYENDGAENFVEHAVDTWPGSADGACSVFAADMDADGDMDVLAASREDDRIAWYENDGQENFTAYDITTSADDARSVFAADLDGDGDMDVLSASYDDDTITWYENDGSGGFIAHAISTSADGATSVFAADMDGDGDLDVLAASSEDNTIAWYENDGAASFTAHSLDTSAFEAQGVFAADLDGDGDMDVVGALGGDGGLPWYENDGKGHFTRRLVTNVDVEAKAVFAADLDGDGDMDVLAVQGSYYHRDLAWYENDGQANFAAAKGLPGEWVYSSYPTDVDGDGDTDIFYAASSEVAWLENDGQGNFTKRETPATGGNSVYGTDIDGDGDVDMLLASVGEDKVAWYEQQNTHFEILGDTLFRELSDLDLSEGDKTYQFTPASELSTRSVAGRTLTVDASFDGNAGDVSIQLVSPLGEVLGADTGSDGYVRIDYRLASSYFEDYTIVISGTNPDVDVRIANVVEVGSTVTVIYGTDERDSFEFSVTDAFNVSVNGIEYTFGLDDASEFRFHGKGDGTAIFHGTPGDDVAALYPDYTGFAARDQSFRIRAYDLRSVTVVGGGGADVAELTDSLGDDVLRASPTEMALSGTLDGNAFALIARDFPEIHAYSRAGGYDTAYLTGSDQADLLKVYPQIVKVIGADYYRRTKFFENVVVDLSSGVDRAVVNPSSGADVVWAMKDQLCVAHDVALVDGEQPAFATMAYNVTASGWENAYARGNASDDWLELHDSAGKDVLIAKPHKIEMMNGPRYGVARGAEYLISARGFRNATAVADQGGDGDVAKLYDSGELGADIWAAGLEDGQTWSTMTSPTRLLYTALAFEYVGGYGFNGGQGTGHGTNRKELEQGIDFVFQYGYWEGEPVSLPSSTSGYQTRGEHAAR